MGKWKRRTEADLDLDPDSDSDSDATRMMSVGDLVYTWFFKHCRDNVAKYMLQDVREKAGLGSPPSPYYTNEVESKNRVLKEEGQYKSSQLPYFVD